ncbi:MAG TPA: anthranilate synthase component I family protein [Micromonosporaceae bacterium]|nr:anthranilate synthase component I family protein [Micromonosporaceae bacterium]
MQVRPNVDLFRGISITERNYVWERSRLEWRVGEPGDPADLAAAFLHGFGLGLLSDSDRSDGLVRPLAHGTAGRARADGILGASLFVSAAAGAVMAGGDPGRPSPCPAVPDLVVALYTAAPEPAQPQAEPATLLPDAAPESPPQPASDRRDGEADEWWLGEWQPSWTPAEHAKAVGQVREAIARGDVYQVNVVGHAAAPYRGDPLPALRRIATLPGAAYGGILTGSGWAIASASPELLVRVAGGVVQTRPIKGTRPATEAGRQELLTSAKERAEHIMIVDLERNDLGRIARTGTVAVPELYAVRRWCDLWQAESLVSARLAEGTGLADLLRALCPGGSVTGAPKGAALAEIARLEPVGRGPSMGAFGWVDAHGLELGLTIRTVAVDDERVHVWAGGGITWESEPAAEVAEAHAKAAPIKRVLTG